MIASPFRGPRSPITVAAETHTPDWRLLLIAGYLPALVAVAASELGRGASPSSREVVRLSRRPSR